MVHKRVWFLIASTRMGWERLSGLWTFLSNLEIYSREVIWLADNTGLKTLHDNGTFTAPYWEKTPGLLCEIMTEMQSGSPHSEDFMKKNRCFPVQCRESVTRLLLLEWNRSYHLTRRNYLGEQGMAEQYPHGDRSLQWETEITLGSPGSRERQGHRT